jgi:hypothetical protein
MRLLSTALLGLASFAIGAARAEVFYLSEAPYLAAAGLLDVESFECVLERSPGDEDPIPTPSFGISIVPLPGNTVAPMGVVTGTVMTNPHATDGTKYLLAGAVSKTNGAFDMTFTFVSPVEAFGAWFTDFGDWTTGSLSAGTNLGGSATIASNPPTWATGAEHFVGIVSVGEPFSTVTIRKSSEGDGIGVDEVSFTPLAQGTSCDAVDAPVPAPPVPWSKVKASFAE